MSENELNQWHVREANVDEPTKWPKDGREDAISGYEEFKDSWDADLEVVDPEGRIVKSQAENNTDSSQEPEIVEEAQAIVGPNNPDTSETDSSKKERMAEGYKQRAQENTTTDINALAKNPIEWLKGKNPDYVNNIKGTDTISKRGFRYIQSQFGISTQSEIVKVFESGPVGVIVWAKAELPDGRQAEAHGEGYQFESSLDDNEFVRYADTRAKSRALADLTSSGAIATEEMKGHEQ